MKDPENYARVAVAVAAAAAVGAAACRRSRSMPEGAAACRRASQGSKTFPAPTGSGGERRWKAPRANEEPQELMEQFRPAPPSSSSAHPPTHPGGL